MASLKFSDTPQYSDGAPITNGKPITLMNKSCLNKRSDGIYIQDENRYYTKSVETFLKPCTLINGTLISSEKTEDPDGHYPTFIEYTVSVGNKTPIYNSAEYVFQVYEPLKKVAGGYRRNRTKRNRNRNRKRKQSRKH